MDALAILKADHRSVEEKFVKYEALGRRALKSKADIVRDVIKALSIHALIEEQYVYPAIRERVAEQTDDVLEALEEHHIVKWTLSELMDMTPDNERFDAKFTVLMENVRHHVKEEEKTLFPAVRIAFTKAELQSLGETLEKGKAAAPSRPHPKAADEPPMNLVSSLIAKPLDAIRDAGESAVRQIRGGGSRKS